MSAETLTIGKLEDVQILVVDDDPDVRESIEAAMLAEGAVTETASDGNTAVAYCNDDPPDLVVLDMMLLFCSACLPVPTLINCRGPFATRLSSRPK